MMREPSASQMAKQLLQTASLQLNTANPSQVRELSRVLDDSLPYPVGDPAYRNSRMLETNFNETSADTLGFVMDAGGPRGSPSDRVDLATRAMADIVDHHMGHNARDWFESRADPQVNGRHSYNWGASLGTTLDRDGVRESYVTYEWRPDLMDALPPALYRIARAAIATLPGLRPVLSTIRCGRSSGTQQITFELERATSLSALQPMMEELGLGAQHSSLMTAAAFLMGARFVLPPETATITLRPARSGVEMRLDVNLDALPDPPERLLPLLRLQMTERPASSRALDKWLMALTPDGFPGPGTVSVLSVWVRPNMAARVALFLRPFVLEADSARPRERRPEGVPERPPSPTSAAAWT
jgi:hypothetical protein